MQQEPEPIEQELPQRPRRRLLGKGGNPVAIALLGVLLCACGFIGGVLVEKGEAGSSGGSGGSSGGIAGRLASLRGGSGGGRGGGLSSLLAGTGAAGGAGAGSSSGGAGGSTGGAGGATGDRGGGPRATIGQVAYTDGDTLYVTDFEGDTIKVAASAGASVTRTVRSSVRAIHPGETVIVTGSSDSSGTVHAQSIRASEGGADAGLGAALFGGGGAGGSGSGAVRSGSSGGGGEGPALFGK